MDAEIKLAIIDGPNKYGLKEAFFNDKLLVFKVNNGKLEKKQFLRLTSLTQEDRSLQSWKFQGILQGDKEVFCTGYYHTEKKRGYICFK